MIYTVFIRSENTKRKQEALMQNKGKREGWGNIELTARINFFLVCHISKGVLYVFNLPPPELLNMV